jgi:hypothetical protein
MEDLLLKFGVVAAVILVVKMMFDFLQPILAKLMNGKGKQVNTEDRTSDTQVLPIIHSAIDSTAVAKINETYDICRDIVKLTRDLKEDHKSNKILLEAVARDSDKIVKLSEKLFEMHDQKDRDGVYVWYVRASMADAIASLAKSVNGLARSMTDDG